MIPAFDDADRLVVLLAALDEQSAQSTRLPVVVVDDASPRPLADALDDRRFPRLDLRVVRADLNGGPGAARNLGLSEVGTPWVAFFDSDEVPAPNWLARLRARVAEPNPPDVIEGRIDVGSERATPFTHIAEAEGWQHVAGNVVYRLEVLQRAGGFSQAYYDAKRKLHFREDTELYFRLEELGASLEFDRDLVALHPPRPPSWSVPLRDARRYHFDALLSRDHPSRFRRFVSERRSAGVPLRWARHNAALLFVLACTVTAAGLIAGVRLLWLVGLIGLLAVWIGVIASLAWRRRVRARDVVPLVVVAGLVPWVYLWHYYRGVIHFRHRPPLR